MTLIVRAAAGADAAELSRVGVESFSAAYRGTADDADIDTHLDKHFSEAAIRREMALPAVRYLIALRNATTAGFVKLRSGERPEPVAAERAIEVQQLYVASDHQRMGVGGRLMDAAMAEARAGDADGIWLSVWTHADWAVAFYCNYGFEIAGELSFRLGRAEFTDYLMWFAFD